MRPLCACAGRKVPRPGWVTHRRMCECAVSSPLFFLYTTPYVYKATCTICGDFYIGMTTRRLHNRAGEHLTAARERSKPSALGEHYRIQHPNPQNEDQPIRPAITFAVLSQHRDILHLHIEEAMATQSLRPLLNRRDEHLGTGFLLSLSFFNYFCSIKNFKKPPSPFLSLFPVSPLLFLVYRHTYTSLPKHSLFWSPNKSHDQSCMHLLPIQIVWSYDHPHTVHHRLLSLLIL